MYFDIPGREDARHSQSDGPDLYCSQWEAVVEMEHVNAMFAAGKYPIQRRVYMVQIMEKKAMIMFSLTFSSTLLQYTFTNRG